MTTLSEAVFIDTRPGAALRRWLGRAVVAVAVLAGLYLSFLLYSFRETSLAVVVLLATGIIGHVYTSSKRYALRYVVPALLAIGVMIVYPIVYTGYISLTNYSGRNLLTFERATDYLLQQSFVPESAAAYGFELYRSGEAFVLVLKTEGQEQPLVTDPVPLPLTNAEARRVKAQTTAFSGGEPLPIRDIVQRRAALQLVTVETRDGRLLTMTGLRSFGERKALYSANPDGSLRNQQSGQVLTPNFETGFYQDAAGNPVQPGFRAEVGFANYIRALTDKGIQGPFLQIFGWTVAFAALSVLFTFAVGVTLASLLQWERLKFRGVYRVLLILPYAVPSFISILVFRGLFNQEFGELNLILSALFGIKPEWTTDPWLAKVMILIVNTWLGFPYMMLLGLGFLQAIPRDLYAAAAVDGAGPFTAFWRITLPALIPPFMPLLIASFGFNFNNFVLIALLTNGRPDILGATTPAGTTDLLVSYTFRIAFEGSGQDFGLASAIAVLIFLMVAVISLINLRLTKAI